MFLNCLEKKCALQPWQCIGHYSLCHNTAVWLLLKYMKYLGKRKNFMLHFRQPKSSVRIFPCISGEGFCVTELQLLSHLTYTMISLQFHLDNPIFNAIKPPDIFLRSKETLVEHWQQGSFTLQKFGEEITGDTCKKFIGFCYQRVEN